MRPEGRRDPGSNTFTNSLSRRWAVGGVVIEHTGAGCIPVQVSPAPANRHSRPHGKNRIPLPSSNGPGVRLARGPETVFEGGRTQALSPSVRLGGWTLLIRNAIWFQVRKRATSPAKAGQTARELIFGFVHRGGHFCADLFHFTRMNIGECDRKILRRNDTSRPHFSGLAERAFS